MTGLYFEDVAVGDTLPELVRETLDTIMLVKWTAAVRDFYPIHFDKDFATGTAGVRDVIAHGPFRCALLARMMVEWIGESGTLHRLYCSQRSNSFVGDMLIGRGEVTRKYRDRGHNYVECNIHIEHGDGSIVVPGRATVSLPSRA